MVRTNQAYMNDESSTYCCLSCDYRFFCSKRALLAHCRNALTHHDEYCDRCDWLFVSKEALDAHKKNSSLHHACFLCDSGRDFQDQARLSDHLEISHGWCSSCEDSFGNANKLKRHRIRHHFMCTTCERMFRNSHYLSKVRLTPYSNIMLQTHS